MDRTKIPFFFRLFKCARMKLLKDFPLEQHTQISNPIDQIILYCGFLWWCQGRNFLGHNQNLIFSAFQKSSEYGFKLIKYLCTLFWDINSTSAQRLFTNQFDQIEILNIALFAETDKASHYQNLLITLECNPDTFCDLKLYSSMESWSKSKCPWENLPSEISIFNIYAIYEKYAGNLDEYVLGAVYEKVLSSDLRKRTGSYYTPQHITKFISTRALQGWMGLPFSEETDLERQFKQAIQEKKKSILENLQIRLNQFTIFDPALGTGHFLVELTRLFMQLIRILNPMTKDPKFIFTFLSKQIFGIDLNHTAVLIARLRLLMTILEFYPEISEHPLQKDTNYEPVSWGIQVGNTLLRNNSNLKEIFDHKYDIIIGNPPYGNLLSPSEQNIVRNFASYPKEIASVFLERMIPLQKEGGVLAMIVTYAITFSKDLSITRLRLAENFTRIKIATFDRDRCRFFEGMTQSVSILIAEGKKSTVDHRFAEIFTTQMYRKMPELTKLNYQSAGDLLLGSSGIGNWTEKHRLPKIGTVMVRSFLDHLNQLTIQSQNNRLGNIIKGLSVVSKEKVHQNSITIGKKNIIDGSRDLWLRISGNYWYNAWDRAPYLGTQIAWTQVINSFWRDWAILIINSSTFYLWFRIYSDGRHLNADIMQQMPIPAFSPEEIAFIGPIFVTIARDLQDRMFKDFDPIRARFLSSKYKANLDAIDIILGILYGFSHDLIDFIVNFESEIRGGKQIRLEQEQALYQLSYNLRKRSKNTANQIITEWNSIFSQI